MENSTSSLFKMLDEQHEMMKELKTLVEFLKRHVHTKDILDEAAFQKEFNVKKRTSITWRKKGWVPYFRIGNRIYYSLRMIVEHALARESKTRQLSLFEP